LTRLYSFENQLLFQLLPFFLLPLKMAATEDPVDLFGEDEDDLFGDEDEVRSEQERALSDRELDSGDDEDRNDRAAGHMDDMAQQIGTHDREARILDADFPRQAVPTPTDGEASLIKQTGLRGTY
jgi:RNA polymerase-associated protein LEO1